MDQIQEFEKQGARPREARSGDGKAAAPDLRALTWLGVAFLIAAVFVLTIPFQKPHDTDAGYQALGHLSSTAILAALILGCTGVIVVAIRVAAGAVVRSLRRPESN